MEVNGRIYGELVAGTWLEFLGRAPRNSATDRHANGWYCCTRCGEIAMIRRADVKPHGTVSCGCKGRKQFMDHFEAAAQRLPEATRQRVWALHCGDSGRGQRRGQRFSSKVISAIVQQPRYTVDFVVAQVCKALRAIAQSGRSILDVALSYQSWRWVERYRETVLGLNLRGNGNSQWGAALQAALECDDVEIEIGIG